MSAVIVNPMNKFIFLLSREILASEADKTSLLISVDFNALGRVGL